MIEFEVKSRTQSIGKRKGHSEQCSAPTEWQGWWTDEPQLYL